MNIKSYEVEIANDKWFEENHSKLNKILGYSEADAWIPEAQEVIKEDALLASDMNSYNHTGIQPPSPMIRNDSFVFLSWDELKKQKFEEPRWIIDKLIPEKGLVAVAGSPESCKSFFTTFLAINIAQGKTLWERF